MVQDVMCCYFGMWTRHWLLLNDDSSKKEGKNVGGAPWWQLKNPYC